jgi:hypothetical protein
VLIASFVPVLFVSLGYRNLNKFLFAFSVVALA